ncbi:ATP-dependent zinc protease [Algiphilus sp.]|uniref:retropepsin-like aspartic peptidase RloA3 n=1 Tax=Algiphilus sp. TaxID=1872431 RepID=UPI0025B9BCEB|nr:ATP-dependent zinc protease [Algiphilus sp.]MCK5769866.1 ATP-dependent zinc protease [Algiphilus sp.]
MIRAAAPALVALAASIVAVPPLQANDEIAHVYGWVEKSRIMAMDAEIKAKLDTGALTSSMHATDIERFERDGDEWVRFEVAVEDERDGSDKRETFERPVYRNVIIRGAGGEERRPVVLMEVCFGSVVHEEQFSLEDRSDMIYPVLIGRRTIQHLGVIDVTRTFLNGADCDMDSPVEKHEGQEADDDIGA